MYRCNQISTKNRILLRLTGRPDFVATSYGSWVPIDAPNFSKFLRFSGYVIATHAFGHDVIGQSDMKNGSSRLEQSRTEVRLELACPG